VIKEELKDEVSVEEHQVCLDRLVLECYCLAFYGSAGTVWICVSNLILLRLHVLILQKKRMGIVLETLKPVSKERSGWEAGEVCIMSSFITCTLHQML